MISEPTNDEPQLTITRTFDAPRTLVFKAWSEPERLAKWWGPKGFTLQVASHEFRPGGMYHYRMASPQGNEMWGKFIYREIVEPEKIVFINAFSDAAGGTTRNPWMAEWPLEILNTLTLVEENGKTALTLRGGPINATDVELKAFAGGVQGMQAGFAGTFEKLDEYLAEAQRGESA